ncbi:hypothetical protein CNR22_09125 [Sphingobacteriaceae bacterium]|nr:hypothetical protein CNR22_09125 [Sphingobacteriaceae bacterium]
MVFQILGPFFGKHTDNWVIVLIRGKRFFEKPQDSYLYGVMLTKKASFICFLVLAFFSAFSQTGPAGVNTSSTNVFWLKADAGTSSASNTTAISSWNDQSGNGIHMTQTVTAQQPSFATNVINGFPAILFDNSTTANQNDKMLGADNSILDNTSGYTFFTVTRPLTLDGNARSIVCKRTGVSIDQSFMIFYYTSNKLHFDIQTTDDRWSSATTFTANNTYLSSLVYNGTLTSGSRCALYVEETFDKNASETSTLVPDNTSPMLIGSTDAGDGRPFGGYIAEVIIYREALGNAQRIIVNNYLSAKYDITLNANDKYAGDNSGNGNYDREVAGLGQESSGSSSSFSASISGGLGMVATAGLDNGDYVFTGHAITTNTTITSDVGGMTGSNRARWQRVWYVDVTNASTNITLDVEFDMSDGGMPTFTLGSLSNYVLLYRSGQTGNWLEVTTASSISGDRIIFNGLSALVDGYITLGTRDFHNSPLPISLAEFTAIPRSSEVDLSWATLSEKNNAFFTLEKSIDGNSFQAFAKIEGAGTSSVLKNYNFTDQDPYPGISYYRLKQTDYDTKESNSELVMVDFKGDEGDLIIFPNPTHGNFKIKFPNTSVKEITVRILDLSGKMIVSQLSVTRGDDSFFTPAKLPQLASGTYVIVASSPTKEYSRKLIIK